MDKRVRLNEICVIGQPRCGYAFSSARSCFIGYRFGQDDLEVSVISGLLSERSIEPVQAGDRLAAGQNAFCTKICSKIITSQFCIVLANNDETLNGEVANANVHMEYGLMLGFNKHVIPFQRESQTLAFNVAGLDTVKYSTSNFRDKAAAAIEAAIEVTKSVSLVPAWDQIVESFCLANGVMMSSVDNEGDQVLFNRGKGLGYFLLHDFTGWNYTYFGVFSQLTAEAVIWRLKRTAEILNGILTSVDLRVKMDFATPQQLAVVQEAIKRFSIWIVVSDDAVKSRIEEWCQVASFEYPVKIILDAEMIEQFDRIATGAAFNGG